MTQPARETTCGHQPHHCKGLCRKCYNRLRQAIWRKAHPKPAPEPMVTTCGHQPHKAKGLCAKCYTRAAWRKVHPDPRPAVGETACGHQPHVAKGLCQKCYGAANYAANREARLAAAKANSGRRKEAARAWRKANPEVRREHHRRRARKLVDADLTIAEWAAILEEFDHRCAYCNRGDLPMEMEHMTPLSRGGRHTASNVVPACRPCNARKYTKTAEEFMAQQDLTA